jgi:hypothetical protein
VHGVHRSFFSTLPPPPGGFDNIPSELKVRIFSDLKNLLRPDGTIVSVVSSPDIYTHEWASFTTTEFPENASAGSGDVVRIVVTDWVTTTMSNKPIKMLLLVEDNPGEVLMIRRMLKELGCRLYR